MTTHWGLDLDMSAIRLMRREGDAWAEVSVEKIDSPDIEDRLTAMLDQLEPGAEVEIFLPKDQILYTSVDLSPVGEARAEIERAMDGRTPYQLDELVFDWAMIDAGRAQVAAIAYDTLEEAAAFAEVRGVGVAGYSSLNVGEDFPRLPRFEGPKIPSATAALAEPEAPPESDAVFATARKPSRPPTSPVAETRFTPVPQPEDLDLAGREAPEPLTTPDAPTSDPVVLTKPVAPVEAPKKPSSEDTLILKPEPGASIEIPKGPVVQVDDTKPVMDVKAPVVPLNPGPPVDAPVAPPRVRTDIAAGSVSHSAASLTPPQASVKVRRGGSLGATAMIFAAVFLVTIAVATLVWTLLPLSPGRTTGEVAPTANTGQSDLGVEETQTAIAPTAPEAEPTLAPEPEPAPTEVAVAPDLADEIDDVSPEAMTSGVALLDPSAPGVAPEVSGSNTPDASPLRDLAALPARPDDEVAIQVGAAPLPELPQPDAQTIIADIDAPAAGTAPTAPGLVADAPSGSVPSLFAALRSGEARPAYDPTAPLPQTPETFRGILISAPFPGPDPDTSETTDEIYIASVESSDLASDAIALPSIFGLRADGVPDITAAPRLGEESATEVAALPPTTEALGTDEAQDEAMAAAVAQALADALAAPGGLIPTSLAASLPERAPRARPGGFVESIERDLFGGRTRSELATFRPSARPASVQAAAAAAAPAPPTAQAVATSFQPRERPENFPALVTAARVQLEAERLRSTVNTRAPDTSSAIQAALEDEPQPQRTERRQLSIPTSTSVARQATIENAIRLNRVNLVGVYGAVSNRRALVRLPTGRYVKVKVGDRVDGGTVAQITDSQLLYRKGNRTLALSMPQG